MVQCNNICIVKKEDKEYPDDLRQIDNPPERLYCIGDVSLLKKRGIAVIGSRKCSEYGKQVAMKIAKAATDNNLTVIAGMAKGIDYFGHLGAIKNGGKTIAVLGGGSDVCYPKENLKLYQKIIDSGLIVSEQPPGTIPKPYMFPLRNRIIAGLSAAVVVAEAGTSSGALITAEQGAVQGKEVFAVPGNINSQYSLGTNKLIVDGARPIAVIDDIFWGIGITPVSLKEDLECLGKDEAQVYQLVKENGEITIDFLCDTLKKDAYFINGIVGVLEIKGLVSYSLGKIFIAKF